MGSEVEIGLVMVRMGGREWFGDVNMKEWLVREVRDLISGGLCVC